MKRGLIPVFVIAMLCAANAAADSPKLKGAYAFTGTAGCLVAPGSGVQPIPGNTVPFANSGFNSSLQPNDRANPNGGDSFHHSFSVEGVRIFNGNGTGSVTGTSVGITVRPTPGPAPAYPHFPAAAGSSRFSYNFTYAINGDGTFTATMVPGSYTETFLTGPRAGQTATIDAIPPIDGAISQDGQTLLVAHGTPTVETVTHSNGDVWPQICHRSRVLIKLPNGN